MHHIALGNEGWPIKPKPVNLSLTLFRQTMSHRNANQSEELIQPFQFDSMWNPLFWVNDSDSDSLDSLKAVCNGKISKIISVKWFDPSPKRSNRHLWQIEEKTSLPSHIHRFKKWGHISPEIKRQKVLSKMRKRLHSEDDKAKWRQKITAIIQKFFPHQKVKKSKERRSLDRSEWWETIAWKYQLTKLQTKQSSLSRSYLSRDRTDVRTLRHLRNSPVHINPTL